MASMRTTAVGLAVFSLAMFVMLALVQEVTVTNGEHGFLGRSLLALAPHPRANDESDHRHGRVDYRYQQEEDCTAPPVSTTTTAPTTTVPTTTTTTGPTPTTTTTTIITVPTTTTTTVPTTTTTTVPTTTTTTVPTTTTTTVPTTTTTTVPTTTTTTVPTTTTTTTVPTTTTTTTTTTTRTTTTTTTTPGPTCPPCLPPADPCFVSACAFADNRFFCRIGPRPCNDGDNCTSDSCVIVERNNTLGNRTLDWECRYSRNNTLPGCAAAALGPGAIAGITIGVAAAAAAAGLLAAWARQSASAAPAGVGATEAVGATTSPLYQAPGTAGVMPPGI